MSAFQMNFAPKPSPEPGGASAAGGKAASGKGSGGGQLFDAAAKVAAEQVTGGGGAGAGKGGRGKGKGRGRGADVGSTNCPACGQPKKANSSYCPEHKKGYDTIYKYSQTEEATCDQDDPDADRHTMSDSYVGSSRCVWIVTFGTPEETKLGPAHFRDVTKAMQILVEFVHSNPSGTEKRKVRACSVNLGKYYH